MESNAYEFANIDYWADFLGKFAEGGIVISCLRVSISAEAESPSIRARLQEYFLPFALSGTCTCARWRVVGSDESIELPPFFPDEKIVCLDNDLYGKRFSCAGFCVIKCQQTGGVILAWQKERVVIVFNMDKVALAYEMRKVIRQILCFDSLRHGSLFLHSACVCVNGEGVLLMGHRKTGKTTNMLVLALGGDCDFVSNDKVLLSKHPKGFFVVDAYPTLMGIDDSTIRLFPQIVLRLRQVYPELSPIVNCWLNEPNEGCRGMWRGQVKGTVFINYEDIHRVLGTRVLSSCIIKKCVFFGDQGSVGSCPERLACSEALRLMSSMVVSRLDDAHIPLARMNWLPIFGLEENQYGESARTLIDQMVRYSEVEWYAVRGRQPLDDMRNTLRDIIGSTGRPLMRQYVAANVCDDDSKMGKGNVFEEVAKAVEERLQERKEYATSPEPSARSGFMLWRHFRGLLSGRCTVRQLLDLLGSEDHSHRWFAWCLLAKLDSSLWLVEVERLIKSEDPILRWSAVEVLAKSKLASVAWLLEEALVDSDSRVRREAAEGIGKVGCGSVSQKLLSLLNDPNTDVRQHVASALGRMKRIDGIGSLLDALTDIDDVVRGKCASAIIEVLSNVGEGRELKYLIRG